MKTVVDTAWGMGDKVAGGYSHIKTYRNVPFLWVAFSQEIPKHGSHFLQKISLHMGSFFLNFYQVFGVFAMQKL